MRSGKLDAHGVGRNAVTYFCPAADGEKEDILEQTSRDAFQCTDCATILIKGRYATESSPDHPYRG